MARPDTTLASVDGQVGDWDQVVDANNDKIEQLCFQEPYPLSHVHDSTADESSSPLADYDAADYKWCIAILVDATSPGTNGYLIYSDGSDWRYQRTDTVV